MVIKSKVKKNLCTPMFIAAQFTIAKYWKQPKCPSANEWIQKLWYIYTMEFHATEKEGAYTLCNSMDGTGEHHAKWNIPDGEGHIPYDLTFNWNIINRRKRKENITRDIEIKNNVTIARREWGGDSGERGL